MGEKEEKEEISNGGKVKEIGAPAAAPPPTNSAPPTNKGGNSHTSATPCGHCRQFLQELRHSAALKICINYDQNFEENVEFKKLVESLSNPFGLFDLLDEKSHLILEEKSNGLMVSKLDMEKNEFLSNGIDNESKKLDFYSNGVDEALKAANNSHAPYSGCPSGVALMDCDGNVYTSFHQLRRVPAASLCRSATPAIQGGAVLNFREFEVTTTPQTNYSFLAIPVTS
ncbi:hypothetical protein LIER_40052 [Lithospermum erythrorhizon]|uniref:Cytidine/deoxycytidylate deaminase zinc-binding domain-containing protein n=1 Tax=Lithospermum erythrorhizon TaxID=34254 RepID=A0AAV3QT12_LITER